MKKILVCLGIIALTFLFSIGFTFAWLESKYSLPAESFKPEKPERLPILAYCEMIENPEKYSGKTVRINANLRWGMHGYFLEDKNCFAEDYSKLTGINFIKRSAGEISRKLQQINPKDRINTADEINIIATGNFEKIEGQTPSSDSIWDNTTLHFEIIEIESGFMTNRSNDLQIIE